MDNNLKDKWQAAEYCPSEKLNAQQIINGQRTTTLQKLAGRYKLFANLGLSLMLLMPIDWYAASHSNLIIGKPVFIFAMIFFGICSITDFTLYKGISRIDCCRMTVIEVTGKILLYRKRHLQFVMLFAPLAIAFIGYVAYSNLNDKYFMYGVIAGSIIGLTIGIRQLLQFMADYRTIINLTEDNDTQEYKS